MTRAIILLKFYKTILDFAHWNNKGYADHLLYDRLRKEIDDVLDSCVEKFLAFTEEVSFNDFKEKSIELMKSYEGYQKQDILEFANYCYEEIDDNDIKDMLKKHIYLLKK